MEALKRKKPWCLNPSQLETWYNDSLQEGTSSFNAHCRRAVNEVITSIHNMCKEKVVPFKVNRVIEGGSLGKGTVVQDLSDVDLIAFINPPHLNPILEVGPRRYKTELADVLRALENALRRGHNVTAVDNNGFLVKFKISVGPEKRPVSIDLLPVADNCLGKPGGHAFSEMFNAMLEQSIEDRKLYSGTVVEHQLKFVGDQEGHVKELIRLVKYWKNDYLPPDLQKSYPLELITIHCWEEARKPSSFSKAQGLKNILSLLTRMSDLQVYWEKYYDSSKARRAIDKFKMKRPIILDPAEPIDDVCSRYKEGNNMTKLQAAARATLQTPLLRDVYVNRNWRN